MKYKTWHFSSLKKQNSLLFYLFQTLIQLVKTLLLDCRTIYFSEVGVIICWPTIIIRAELQSFHLVLLEINLFLYRVPDFVSVFIVFSKLILLCEGVLFDLQTYFRNTSYRNSVWFFKYNKRDNFFFFRIYWSGRHNRLFIYRIHFWFVRKELISFYIKKKKIKWDVWDIQSFCHQYIIIFIEDKVEKRWKRN